MIGLRQVQLFHRINYFLSFYRQSNTAQRSLPTWACTCTGPGTCTCIHVHIYTVHTCTYSWNSRHPFYRIGSLVRAGKNPLPGIICISRLQDCLLFHSAKCYCNNFKRFLFQRLRSKQIGPRRGQKEKKKSRRLNGQTHAIGASIQHQQSVERFFLDTFYQWVGSRTSNRRSNMGATSLQPVLIAQLFRKRALHGTRCSYYVLYGRLLLN